MLVLSRKVTEEILIGDSIRVKVTRLSGNRVSLAIEAPQEARILRGECLDTTDACEPPLRLESKLVTPLAAMV